MGKAPNAPMKAASELQPNVGEQLKKEGRVLRRAPQSH